MPVDSDEPFHGKSGPGTGYEKILLASFSHLVACSGFCWIIQVAGEIVKQY